MLADICNRLVTTSFVPFSIRMADGREYPVPTRDHIWLPPGGTRVIVADDDGATMTLPALLISGIVEAQPQGAPHV